jgi:hypothetical protein
MQQTFSAASWPALANIAEGLLWLGHDRAADAIYAAIEEAEAQAERDEWAEAFAG